MFWAAPCVRIHIQLGHVRNKRCSHFHVRKRPSFLDRPILPSEKPVTLCVSKDKQSHRLVGTSETFYESHSPPFFLLVTLSLPSHTHTSTLFRSRLFSVVLFPLSGFFFKHFATSLPDIELASSSITSRLL